MKELITISPTLIHGHQVNTVNGRDLHSFLGSKQEFANWIKGRISQYGFIQDTDFIQFDNFIKSDSRARIEYHLTIDMAKELSMVERNDKGKQARQYFIECERQVKDPVAAVVSMNKSQILMLAADQAKKIEEMQPKVEAFDRLAYAEGDLCITDAAKALQIRRKDLFDFLITKKWIYKRAGGKHWLGYQDKVQQGLLTHKITTVTDVHTGMEKVREQVLITPKGLAKLASMMGEVVNG